MHITYTLHCSTCRNVEIATISRPEHRVAQTREVACTKIVLPQVIARGLHLCATCISLAFYVLYAFEDLNITEPGGP